MKKKINLFSQSDIRSQNKINEEIINQIEDFEAFLYKELIVDEAFETTLASSYNIKYLKDGVHILTIYPSKDNWDMEINALLFNLYSFCNVEMTFNVEKMTWKLFNMIKIREINNLIGLSLYPNDPLSLVPFIQNLNIVLLIQYISYNNKIFNSSNVSSLFWNAKFDNIEKIMNAPTTFLFQDLYNLIQKWEKQASDELLPVDGEFDKHNISSVEGYEGIMFLLKFLSATLKNNINAFKKSIGNYLFSNELVFNNSQFMSAAEKYRDKLEKCHMFLNDIEKAITTISNNQKIIEQQNRLESNKIENQYKTKVNTNIIYENVVNFFNNDKNKVMFVQEIIRGTNKEGLFLISVVKSRYRFGLRKQKIFERDLTENYLDELITHNIISVSSIGLKKYGVFNEELWRQLDLDIIDNIIKNVLNESKLIE